MENVVALFDNWSEVIKYSNIAENSYGTATKKMEAYNDSLEASQNRVTAAIEKKALSFNGSGLLIQINNILADVIDNVEILTGSILALGVAMNKTKLMDFMTKGGASISSNLMGFNNFVTGFAKKDSVNTTSFRDQLNEIYDAKLNSKYNNVLLNYSRDYGVQGKALADATEYQNKALGWNKLYRQASGEFLTSDVGEDVYQKAMKAYADTIAVDQAQTVHHSELMGIINSTQSKSLTFENLMNEANQKGIALTNEEVEAIRKRVITEEKVAQANTKATQTMKSGATLGEGKVIGKTLQDRNTTTVGSLEAVKGVASITGLIVGGIAGSSLTSELGGVGQTLGGILGSTMGATVGTKLVSALSAGSLKAGMAALGGTAGLVGLGVIVAGLVWQGIKSYNEKKLKEAQEKFQKLSQNLKDAINIKTDLDGYEDLVKGVDELGNNVSLTDDEYEKFLTTSKEIADAFPELIVRTDDAGNSFVGLNGKVADVTSTVDDLTKALQRQTDAALLDDSVVKDALKTASKTYRGGELGKTSVDYYLKQLDNGTLSEVTNEKVRSAFKEAGIAFKGPSLSGVIDKELFDEDAKNKAKGILTELSASYESEMNEATQSISDYAKAKVRETLTSAGTDISNYTEEEQQVLYSAASAISPEEKNYEVLVSETTKKISKLLKDNPEYLDVLFNVDETMSSEDFHSKTESLKKILQDTLGLDEDGVKKILIQLGWDSSGLNTNDGFGKILAEGLDKKVQGNFAGVFGKEFNTKEMSYAYNILKGAGGSLTQNQLRNSIYSKEYNNMNLSQLAKQYEVFKKAKEESVNGNGEWGTIESENWDRVKSKLDSYAKELESLPGEYDKIIEKAKVYGDLTWGGMSEKSIEDVKSDSEDYKKIYDYLQNDFNGVWNTDTLNSVLSHNELLENANNPEALEAQLKELLNGEENAVNNSIQNKLASTEEGTKLMIKNAGSLVDEFKKKYGIDLNNFTTLKEAELQIQQITNSTIEGDVDSWVVAMSNYYVDDLSNYTDAAYKKIALAKLVMSELGKAEEVTYFADEADQAFSQKERNDIANSAARKAMSAYSESKNLSSIQEDITNILNKTNFANDSGTKDSSSDSGKTAAEEALDLAKAKVDLIDKETEAMKALEKAKTLEEAKDTDYYAKKQSALKEELVALQNVYKASTDDSEKLGYLKEIQDVQKEIKNLNDEELSDKESWAETLGQSLDRLHQIYVAEIHAADTYEEKINAQKKLDDLILKEYDYRIKINEANKTDLQRKQSYVNPLNSDYSKYTEEIKKEEQNNANEYLSEANWLLALHKKRRLTEYNSNGQHYTEAEAEAWAKEQEDYTTAMQKYYESLSNITQVALDDANAKVTAIQDVYDTIESTKPKKWTQVSDITKYATSQLELLTEQTAEYTRVLNSNLELTYEQTAQLVKSINDNIKKQQELKTQEQQDIVDLKSETYDALTWQVEEYIDAISRYKEVVDKAYDDEIKKLRDINTSKERTIKLTQLLQNLENAQNEGSRVYREGIGFVYTKNRSAIKKAQQELNSFYAEDQITDLQNTKETEDAILDERVKNWEDYLKAIEKAYQSYEDETKRHLLFVEFGVDSEEELFNKFYADMINNTQRMSDDVLNGLNNYSGVMDNFLDDYKSSLEELDTLQKQLLDLLSIGDEVNNTIGNQTSSVSQYNEVKASDWIKQANGTYKLNGSNLTVSVGDVLSKDWAKEALNSNNVNDLNNNLAIRVLKASLKDITLGEGKYQSNEEIWNQAMNSSTMQTLSTNSTTTNNNIVSVLGALYGTNNSVFTSMVNGINTVSTSLYGINSGVQTLTTIKNSNTAYSANGQTTVNAQGQTVTAGSTGVLNTAIYNGLGSSSKAYDKLTGVDYARNETLANSVVQQGRYQVYYDELGYVSKAIKTGESAGYTVSGVSFNAQGQKVDNYGNVIVENNSLSSGSSSSGGIVKDYDDYDSDTGIGHMGSHLTYGNDSDSGSSGSSGSSGAGTGNGPSKSDVENNTPGWDLVGFADGIERGAVTYTGMAMLHGTPTKPEYVLNNDQMVNFIRNMSSAKTPAYERTNVTEAGNNYNLYGDFNLPNVNDPSNFWSELMKATDNRINVTKNK